MTPDEIRTYATELIIDHARDIEFLSISEGLEEQELPEEEHDELCRQIDELVRTATITVEFPDAPGDPQ